MSFTDKIMSFGKNTEVKRKNENDENESNKKLKNDEKNDESNKDEMKDDSNEEYEKYKEEISKKYQISVEDNILQELWDMYHLFVLDKDNIKATEIFSYIVLISGTNKKIN